MEIKPLKILLFFNFLICKQKQVLFLFFLILNTANAQHFSTKIFTTNDGLPSSHVEAIYQDSNDYLWCSTINGISRFDGKKFLNFGLKDGLPNIYSEISLEDSHHRYWFVSRRGMGALISNKFVTYPLNDSLQIHYVFDIIENKDGKIWALTQKGVYQFEDSIWIKIKLFPGFENNACRNIVETDSGMYVNYGQLLVFKNKLASWNIIVEKNTIGPYLNILTKYKNTILANTRNELFSLENNQLVPKVTGIKGIGYFNYLIDSRNRFWYYFSANENSIRISYPNNWSKIEREIPNKFGQLGRIKEDKLGNIWIGTQEGLLKITESSYTMISESDSTIAANTTTSIVLKDSALLLSTTQGIILYYPNKTLQKEYLLEKNETIIDNSSIDEKNRIWFNTRFNGLYRLSGNKLTNFTSLLKNIGVTFSIAYNKINQSLFICTEYGLYIYHNQKIELFKPSNIHNQLPIIIRMISFANGNTLLMGNNDHTYIINKLDSIYEWNEENQDNKFNILFYESPTHSFWVVNLKNGLNEYRFDHNNQIHFIQNISEKEGLQNYTINSLTFDSNQRIWVASTTGLDILQKNKTGNWEVFNYNKSITINANWAYGKLVTDVQGFVWLSTWHNLVKFDPKNISLTKQIPKVVIEKILLNMQNVNWKKYSDSDYNYLQFPINPKFQYADNTISFLASGISYTSSPDLEFSYHLIPIDKDWSFPSKNPAITFVKLAPGSYTFQIKTRDQNSAWSNPVQFSFIIQTPFWLSWWFNLLSLFTLLTIIYFIYKFRINQLKKFYNIRTKISQDLHDEIGGSLSGIKLFSQMANDKLNLNQTQLTANYLNKITTYSNDVIEKLSDIVWIFNPKNDSSQNLINRLKLYLFSLANAKGILINFDIEIYDKVSHLSILEKKTIYLISKEAINNAVKYSNCKNIFYAILKKDSKLSLIIEDDGIGFNTDNHYEGNGFQNMKARSAEINAHIKIESTIGKGTRIELLL